MQHHREMGTLPPSSPFLLGWPAVCLYTLTVDTCVMHFHLFLGFHLGCSYSSDCMCVLCVVVYTSYLSCSDVTPGYFKTWCYSDGGVSRCREFSIYIYIYIYIYTHIYIYIYLHYRSKVWGHLEMSLFFKEKHCFYNKDNFNQKYTLHC